MYYQKKVVRKSLYQKAIDSRGQQAKWACLYTHLETYSRLRNKCGNELETIRKEEKIQEEKD